MEETSQATSSNAGLSPSHSRRISETAAFYLYPRSWIGGRPTMIENDIKLVTIFDEVYRRTLESGIVLKVLRFGLFVFDFSRSELRTHNEADSSFIDQIAALQLRRISILNVYLLCLYTAIYRRTEWVIERMLLEPMDTIGVNGLDDLDHIYTPFRLSDSELLPQFSQLRDEFFAHAADGDRRYRDSQMKWHQEDFSRFLISVEVIESSLDLLTSILKHPAEHMLLLLEMFAHACKDYEDLNYAFALVTCWTIVERLLQVQWNRFVKTQATQEVEIQGKKVPFVDKTRRDRLNDHRSFTSAVIAEILTFNGVIPFATYDLLSKIRSARNAWVHELKPISREQSSSAIKLVEIMLREIESIDLDVPIVDRLMIQT
jgi:hypothetical protein